MIENMRIQLKSKGASLLLGFLIVQTMAFSQSGKYGASVQDSITCVENLSVYKDFLKEQNFDKAKIYSMKAYAVCPSASLKLYVDAESIFTNLIAANSGNQARARELMDTLFMLYDSRIANFGKEGYVLGKKGAAMIKYNYPGYQQAFDVLKKSVQTDGNEAQAAALIYYFQAAVKLNEKEAKPSAFWVEMFNECVTICDYNIANRADPKERESYISALDNILKLADPFLNCKVLVEYFTAKYEEKKEQDAWLASVAKILNQKDCAEDPFFFKVASQLHARNPTSASAKNMGIMSVKKGQYSDAAKYFTQAIELTDRETDDANLNNLLSELELLLAKAYFGAKNYAAARSHAQKATTYKTEWGEPYILIGDMYASSVAECNEGADGALKSPYWIAVDMYARAKSLDPSVAAEASQKIARYSQYFPTKQDAFFHGVTDGTDYTIGCWINATTKTRLR